MQSRLDLIGDLRLNFSSLDLAAIGAVEVFESKFSCLGVKIDLGMLPGDTLFPHRITESCAQSRTDKSPCRSADPREPGRVAFSTINQEYFAAPISRTVPPTSIEVPPGSTALG